MNDTQSLRYRLEPDTNACDPRKDWDHFATLVCDHRRYELGDRKATAQELEAYERGGFALLARYLRRYEGAVYLAPLGLIDHSGISMWIGGGHSPSDPGGWDSGTVGFVYVTREQLDAAGTPDGMTQLEQAKAIAEQEVAEYDAYISGDVWGYIVETEPKDDDVEPEELDSCWGYYGYEWAEQAAQDALAAIKA